MLTYSGAGSPDCSQINWGNKVVFAKYGAFGIVSLFWDNFSRIFEPHATPHAPGDVVGHVVLGHVVPVLIGCCVVRVI